MQDFDFTGQGTLTFPNGRTLRGNWLNGKLNGAGEELFNRNLYRGQWRDGQRHGRGMFLSNRGTTYEGAWVEGKRHGYGVATYANHVRYEGMWQADQRHGFGEEIRPNRTRYRGEWLNDMRHGSGVETHANGGSFEGEWVEDHALGTGTLTQPSGVQISGVWTGSNISNGLVVFPDGMQYAGPIYTRKGEALEEKYISWLQEAANNGSAYAQLWLAQAYLDGTSGSKNEALAEAWLEKAAQQGLVPAQYQLATRRLQDDWPQSEAWLKNAAENAHSGANALLGEFYHMGHHFEQNLELAIAHYERAVAHGSVRAANNLAWLLATTDTHWADVDRASDLLRPLVMYLDSWRLLDTFAAIQARQGKFELAQTLQRRALEEARDDPDGAQDVPGMEERLGLYQAGEAYIEPLTSALPH